MSSVLSHLGKGKEISKIAAGTGGDSSHGAAGVHGARVIEVVTRIVKSCASQDQFNTLASEQQEIRDTIAKLDEFRITASQE